MENNGEHDGEPNFVIHRRTYGEQWRTNGEPFFVNHFKDLKYK